MGQEDLILKDDGNIVIVARRSLLNHIFVVFQLKNHLGDGRYNQVLIELIEPSREQAPLIPPRVKFITDFEKQAMDFIKEKLEFKVIRHYIKFKQVLFFHMIWNSKFQLPISLRPVS
uniref:Arp2/3 complex 34 kDa subunit n=1 Tax=Heterorhabditis bacteriophora TaxID=37862 RepID=A0A1I7X618_HETBA